MVKICFLCGGVKGCLFYYVVVIDQCNKCDGCNIENVGFYNLVVVGKDKCFEFNVECVKEWVGKGVQLIDKVVVFVKEVGKQQVV